MISYIFFIILTVIALWCMLQISIADFRRRIIPDAYLVPLMLIGLIFISFFSYPINITNAAIGATFGYISSVTIGLIFDYKMRKKNATITPPIGMGDIKLITVGGLWLGVGGLSYALIIACITGAIWARHNKQKFIPFAPFFIIGGILSFLLCLFLIY